MHVKVIGQAKFVGAQTTKCKKQFVPMYLILTTTNVCILSYVGVVECVVIGMCSFVGIWGLFTTSSLSFTNVNFNTLVKPTIAFTILFCGESVIVSLALKYSNCFSIVSKLVKFIRSIDYTNILFPFFIASACFCELRNSSISFQWIQ